MFFNLLAAIPEDPPVGGGIPGINNPAVGGLKNADPDRAPALFGNFIGALVGVVLVVGTLWALAQFLIGALAWISSGGDKGRLEAAQERIRQAIIGLIVLAATWALYVVILRWLGIFSDGGFVLPSLF